MTKGRTPALPQRWDFAEAIAQTAVLAFTNVIDPFDIDAGEARFDAIPDLFVDLGWTRSTGERVATAIRAVADQITDDRKFFGTKTRVLTAAVGLALLAAGPVGIATGAAAGVAGAAAITSGLAAFGPGGMVGGLAMLGGLSSTGAMVTTFAATTRAGHQPTLVDPTSVAIQVAIAHALNSVDEPYDTELWYRLTTAESELTAELNRVGPYSDEKASSVLRMKAAAEAIDDLMTFMVDHHLAPSAIAEGQVAATPKALPA